MIMGLISSEQVPGDGRGWSSQGGSWKSGGVEMSKPREASLPPQHMLLRHQRQQRVPLRCPRCDSPNTKFCYYNNYNRSQPRHFCKACRRHWTDGGTLRNVPVGGRRKAKRPRTSRHPPAPNPNPVHHHHHHHHDGASNELPPTQVLPPPPSFGPGILCRSLLETPPPPPDYANSGDIGSSNRSYLLGALLPPPPSLHFGSGVPASHDTSMPSPFTSFLNLAGQDDPTAVYAGFTISTGTAPWELLPPSSCSSSTVTTGSGLTVAGSSAYWGSCWDDLTGVLSPDHKHPTPLLPPPQDLQLS